MMGLQECDPKKYKREKKNKNTALPKYCNPRLEIHGTTTEDNELTQLAEC